MIEVDPVPITLQVVVDQRADKSVAVLGLPIELFLGTGAIPVLVVVWGWLSPRPFANSTQSLQILFPVLQLWDAILAPVLPELRYRPVRNCQRQTG